MKLLVILASTRPGRACLPIANWFLPIAKTHAAFEIEIADLLEIALPHIDEPGHPRFQKYEHEHTKKWSATVNAADAFVVVLPEYNFAAPPALLNAFDYLFKEWQYKPAGFVSYGGVSGGLRSAEMVKGTMTALKMMPLPEAVTIPFFAQMMKDGKFVGSEPLVNAAHAMLDELARWSKALASLRA